jgi:hypothetical protein
MPDLLIGAMPVRATVQNGGVRGNGDQGALLLDTPSSDLDQYALIRVRRSIGLGPLRTLLLTGFRLIEQQTSYEAARRVAEQLAGLLVSTSPETAAEILRSLRGVASPAPYRDLINALAYVHLGNAMQAIIDLLGDLSRDPDISLRQASEDALAAIEFAHPA